MQRPPPEHPSPSPRPRPSPAAPAASGPWGDRSKVIRHTGDFSWEDVALEPYKDAAAAWSGITRRELIGRRGESQRFHVRYFEIAAGGYSTLEKHEHGHVVIPIRGTGVVRFGGRAHRVAFGDVVYIAAGDAHQFRNEADAPEPFGFLCIVNAERDRPRPVEGPDACSVCE